MSSVNPTTGDNPNQNVITQQNPLADAPTAQHSTEDPAFAPLGPKGVPEGPPDQSRLGGGDGQQAWEGSAKGNIPAQHGDTSAPGSKGAMPMPAGTGAETGGDLRGREDWLQSTRAAPGQSSTMDQFDNEGRHAGGTMEADTFVSQPRMADRIQPDKDAPSAANTTKTAATFGASGMPAGPLAAAMKGTEFGQMGGDQYYRHVLKNTDPPRRTNPEERPQRTEEATSGLAPSKVQDLEAEHASEAKEPRIGAEGMAPRSDEGSLPASSQVPQREEVVPEGGGLAGPSRRYNAETKQMTVVDESGGPPQVYDTQRRRFNVLQRKYHDAAGNKKTFYPKEFMGVQHSSATPPDPYEPAQGTHAPPPGQSQPSSSRQAPAAGGSGAHGGAHSGARKK
jgi:hypothetical protein